jgi:hypothetical protein
VLQFLPEGRVDTSGPPTEEFEPIFG